MSGEGIVDTLALSDEGPDMSSLNIGVTSLVDSDCDGAECDSRNNDEIWTARMLKNIKDEQDNQILPEEILTNELLNDNLLCESDDELCIVKNDDARPVKVFPELSDRPESKNASIHDIRDSIDPRELAIERAPSLNSSPVKIRRMSVSSDYDQLSDHTDREIESNLYDPSGSEFEPMSETTCPPRVPKRPSTSEVEKPLKEAQYASLSVPSPSLDALDRCETQTTREDIPIDPLLLAAPECSISPTIVPDDQAHRRSELIKRVKGATSRHLRQMRAIFGLDVPFLSESEVRELLRLARISIDPLTKPLFDPDFLPIFTHGSEEDTDSDDDSSIDKLFKTMLQQPMRSSWPQLYVSALWPHGMLTGDIFDKLPFEQVFKEAEGGSASKDTMSSTPSAPQVMLQMHIKRIKEHQYVGDEAAVWYPLGYVPVSEWESFTDVFGLDFDNKVVFDVDAFVRAPNDYGPESTIEKSRPLPQDASKLRAEFELNRYDPVYTRISPTGRESYCGACEMFYKRDKSNWLHHMKSGHGVRSRTLMSYELPLIVTHHLLKAPRQRTATKPALYFGYCDECQSWQPVNGRGGQSPLCTWFLHKATHDIYRNRMWASNRETKARRSSEKRSNKQANMAKDMFGLRRRTLLNIQRIIMDHMRNGESRELGKSSFFRNQANFWMFSVLKPADLPGSSDSSDSD